MNINNIDSSIELPIMERFYSIQGEGRYSGRAAYFIRVAGCDVGCVWCDVKESWDNEIHPLVKIDELVQGVLEAKADFVVITGGEPALYDLNTMVNALHQHGIATAIETSGCYPLKGAIQWYCFSPKKFKAPCEEAYEKASEMKVIIFNKSDFKWAEEHAAKLNSACVLYLQPEWSKEAQILPLIIEYVKLNPKWRVSLQTHKYMDIP
ncbi:MAG: 7-carboxy-7-deazaguanine synthase QueE [Crocinitomicaceae bacterium]|nr:7-carboxy-7-deazaguanine synthase QueE [Crocinitomicaceae bacterium]